MTTDIWRRLEQLSTAHLCDVMMQDGVRERVLSPQLRPVLPFQKMLGTVVTMRFIESEQMEEVDLEKACQYALGVDRPILAVECHGPDHAPVGSCVGGTLRIHGFVGAVVDGTVRDSNDLYEMNFQVYGQRLFPQNQGCFRWEWRNEPVTVGGVIIQPGDIIFGDHDGLVTLPSDMATLRRYIEEGEKILASEDKLLSELSERVGGEQ